MSDSWGAPWSDNPNAPKIPNWLYSWEKGYFTGSIIGAISYGIVIVLFFQCMSALLDPANRTREGISWKFVAHTAAMFSFATVYIAMTLNIQSISFIDNRGFSGTSDDDTLPPGPIGYQWFIRPKATGIAPTPMVVLNNWLADGLLLYRCHIVYAMNYSVIAFPFMMYLAGLATGITLLYQTTRPDRSVTVARGAAVHFGTPYFLISFSLNVLLTLMIITRLVLHRKNIRNAMGATSGAGGLYMAAVTILVESSALYAVSFLLYIGTMASGSSVQDIFLQILAQTQVIAQFLITLRVANRRSLTSDTIVSGSVGSIRFSSQGKPMAGGETLPGGYPTDSAGADEFGIEIETTIELHRDMVSGSEGSLKA